MQPFGIWFHEMKDGVPLRRGFHQSDIEAQVLRLLGLALATEFFHYRGDEFLGAIELLHDDLNVHGRLAELSSALAVDAVLADERKRVSKHVEGDGEASAGQTHPEFEMFKFLALFVEDTHAVILNGTPLVCVSARR